MNHIERVAYFEIENFHFNLRPKKVHAPVNGILQFIRFMPSGFFFLFCVLLPLFTSLSETFYLAFSLCPYVYSAERSELPSLSLNTNLIPLR